MERRLAAVLVADIVGYSRLMEADEVGVLKRQSQQLTDHILPSISQHNGRIVKTTGDGFLAEFPSVVDAVDCAVSFQGGLGSDHDPQSASTAIRYRAGINIGDIIIQGDDIFGDGVNVAARLEAIAPPGGLCISELVWQNLRGALSGEFQDIGPQSFKNIDRRIRAWKWPMDEGATASHPVVDNAASQVVQLAIPGFGCSPSDNAAREFTTGLIDDLTIMLSKLDTLAIVRQNSETAQYDLNGNARTAGGQVRCNISLCRTGDTNPLWAERFDGSLDDLFGFQDTINETVAAAIEVELSDGQQVRRWRQEAGNARAYGLFQEGRAAYKEYSRPANARAKELFTSALQAAPSFLSASVGLARTTIEDAHFGWSDDGQASLQAARVILDGVLSINPDHSAAHAEVAHFHMISCNYDSAVLAGEFAVALDPNDADAHNCLAYILNCVGRCEESLNVSRRALTLIPNAPEFYLLPIAHSYLALGRYAEALGVADRILGQRPAWLTTHVLKILALQGAGREQAAREALQDMQAINPRFTISRWRQTLQNMGPSEIPRYTAFLEAVGMPE